MAELLLLHADDDPNDLFLVQRAFDEVRPDVQLESAQDGQQAIEYLAARLRQPRTDKVSLPKVVLLDIKMPRVDGFEVLSWIRQRPELAFVSVIMLSSSSSEAEQQRAAALGANYFIQKSCRYSDLPRELQPWLDARQS